MQHETILSPHRDSLPRHHHICSNCQEYIAQLCRLIRLPCDTLRPLRGKIFPVGYQRRCPLEAGLWFSLALAFSESLLAARLLPKKMGVTYSRPTTGTRMPTQERFRARPAWACLEPCPVNYKFRVLLWTAAEAANCLCVFSGLLFLADADD